MAHNEAVDVVLVGAGIMSATLAVLLKELDPGLKLEVVELMDSGAAESSNPWNNAGTGHAGLCELNYTPQAADGSIDIKKAVHINTQFEVSKQFWAYLTKKGTFGSSKSFISPVPHLSFVPVRARPASAGSGSPRTTAAMPGTAAAASST